MYRLFTGGLLCLTVAGFVACQSAEKKKDQSAGSTPTSEVTIPDSSLQQIAAADTLFEDGSRPTGWDNAGFDDPAAFKKFLAVFRDWVQHNEVDSITAHIKFPLAHYKTADVFKKQYDSIFNPALKSVVLQQRLDRIFRNYQGAMMGNGEIWWAQLDGHYKIIAINK